MSVRISNSSLTWYFFFENWSNVFWVPNFHHHFTFTVAIFFWKRLIKCFFWDQKYRNFSKTSKWILFFENWSNVFEVLTSILSAETPVILALSIKDRIKKNSFSKNVMTFHCLIKLVYWSQKLCKFSAFSLKFSKVLQ